MDRERAELVLKRFNRLVAQLQSDGVDCGDAKAVADAFDPQPINLFMNIPVGEDGSLGWEPAPTAAGDSITLRAAMDAIVVVSACPQDIVPINDRNPTSIAIELLDGD